MRYFPCTSNNHSVPNLNPTMVPTLSTLSPARGRMLRVGYGLHSFWKPEEKAHGARFGSWEVRKES